MKKQLVGLLLLGLFSMDQAFAAMSTFDTDADGWSYYNRNPGGYNPSSLTWESSGGNPGGFMKFTDGTSDHAAISAPSKFLGNWGDLDYIQYDFKIIQSSGTNPSYLPQHILLKSNDITAVWEGDVPNGVTDWTTQRVMLNDSGWSLSGGTLEQLLANVTEFIITIELVSDDFSDIEGIDNVMVSAVPVPAALWLFTSGILGLVAQARRKRVTA